MSTCLKETGKILHGSFITGKQVENRVDNKDANTMKIVLILGNVVG
jgi:hypothetical protein